MKIYYQSPNLTYHPSTVLQGKKITDNPINNIKLQNYLLTIYYFIYLTESPQMALNLP